MSWGSFLLGGLVFGLVAFVLGLAFGVETTRAGAAEKVWKKMILDLRERMVKDETVAVELIVRRFVLDDDGDDDGEDETWGPVEPDKVGTGLWDSPN